MVTRPKPIAVLIALAFLLPACAFLDDRSSSTDESSTLLLEAEAYPCTLRFEPTGVTLAPTPDGSVPDPGAAVSVFADGRFVTATPHGGSVLVWSPEGKFLHRIGREGTGPGEMGLGVYPIVGDDGTLHTIDISQARWSRFAPDGTFLSSGRSIHFMEGRFFLEILGTDSLLTLAGPPPKQHQFYVVAGDGRVLRAFGERQSTPTDQRAIALSPQGTVWIGPPYGSPTYQLEEWSLDGRLLRRIDRQVEWLSRIAGEAPAHSSEDPSSYPLSIRLDATQDGLLVIAAFNWGLNDAVPGPVHLEVIDPASGTVLASQTLDPATQPPPQFLSAPGPRSAYRLLRDDLDLTTIEMLRYHLDPAPGASRDDAASCTGPKSAPRREIREGR